jgi:transposase
MGLCLASSAGARQQPRTSLPELAQALARRPDHLEADLLLSPGVQEVSDKVVRRLARRNPTDAQLNAMVSLAKEMGVGERGKPTSPTSRPPSFSARPET